MLCRTVTSDPVPCHGAYRYGIHKTSFTHEQSTLELFDQAGIIAIDGVEDAKNVISSLSADLYHKMLPAARRNFETAQSYLDPLGHIWEHGLEQLIRERVRGPQPENIHDEGKQETPTAEGRHEKLGSSGAEPSFLEANIIQDVAEVQAVHLHEREQNECGAKQMEQHYSDGEAAAGATSDNAMEQSMDETRAQEHTMLLLLVVSRLLELCS